MIVFQYGDSELSFPNVFLIKYSIFTCTNSTKRAPCEFPYPPPPPPKKKKSVLRTRARTSICSHGIHSNFVEFEVAMESVNRK